MAEHPRVDSVRRARATERASEWPLRHANDPVPSGIAAQQAMTSARELCVEISLQLFSDALGGLATRTRGCVSASEVVVLTVAHILSS